MGWVSPTSRLAQGPGPFPPQQEEGTGAEEHLSWRIAMGAGGDGKIWILYKKKRERERPATYHAPRHHLAALPRPPRFQPEPSRSPKWDRSGPWRRWALGCESWDSPRLQPGTLGNPCSEREWCRWSDRPLHFPSCRRAVATVGRGLGRKVAAPAGTASPGCTPRASPGVFRAGRLEREGVWGLREEACVLSPAPCGHLGTLGQGPPGR